MKLYCPKCGHDVEGDEALCPDCGSLLVIKAEDALEENRVPLVRDTPEVIDRMAAYLEYSGLENVEKLPDEDGETVHLVVKESKYRTAVRMLSVYALNEAANQLNSEEGAEDPEDGGLPEDGEEAEDEEPVPVRAYEKRADKRADIHSSGVSLVVVGAGVLLFMLLVATGTIPLRLNTVSKIISGSVMGIMGLSFLIYGIISLKKARDMAEEVVEEEEITEDIEGWFSLTYTAEDIDADLTEEQGELTLEERQLGRLAAIKNAILSEYEIEDEAFVDELSEQLYQKLYESGPDAE